jgi:hypothetical protein
MRRNLMPWSRKASRKVRAAQLERKRREKIAKLEYRLKVQDRKAKITRRRVGRLEAWLRPFAGKGNSPSTAMKVLWTAGYALGAIVPVLQVLLRGR